jgi:RNA polymerase sigma-70 factor (ECF subfamily)
MPKKARADFLGYYNQYKDKIYTYLWYRVGFNQALAEDLTSEVFIKALKNFDSYDQDRPFQAWIYKIAQNHLINHYKTAQRETELVDSIESPRLEHEAIETKLELERVMGHICELDQYHQEVLLLRYVDCLDNREIAAVLDKEEGAVRTQISRALEELRKRIC